MTEPVKICLSFGGSLESSNVEKGLLKILCNSPCMRVKWELLNTLG